MKNVTYSFVDLNKLHAFLSSSEIQSCANVSKSTLIQIFSSQDKMDLLKKIVAVIEDTMPTTIVVGTTTIGEILEGKLQVGTILLSMLFFDDTVLKTITQTCISGNEFTDGQELIQAINDFEEKIAGVLILGTPLSSNISELFRGMSEKEVFFPVFGGGAATYDLARGAIVFCGTSFIYQGIVAIVFLSSELQIYVTSHLGWKPLSKEMTITESYGKLVKTVDKKNTYDIYHKYLGIENDEKFYFNVLEFPFLLERDGYTIARVPFLVHDGAIEFIADIYENEKVRIGYGDPEEILQDSKSLQKSIGSFAPEAIFTYSCICRRFLLQNAVNYEIQPFQGVAPTTGFFTSGEFFCHNNKLQLLNCAMIVVGMREGKKHSKTNLSEDLKTENVTEQTGSDPYSDKHSRIVSRLLHYINVQTSELEEANQDLMRLSEIDKLTQIYNRMKLDNIIEAEINRSNKIQTHFAMVLLDVDNFKEVNDKYGHLIGDDILSQLAVILKKEVGKEDYVGRWGGEEFLIILPSKDLEQACLLAEKIRSTIQLYVFPKINHITCSLGVTVYKESNNRDNIILHADKALYQAKHKGRNRVEYYNQ